MSGAGPPDVATLLARRRLPECYRPDAVDRRRLDRVLAAGRLLPFPGAPGCRAVAIEAPAMRAALVRALRAAGCDPVLADLVSAAPVHVVLCRETAGPQGEAGAWVSAAQMAVAAEEGGLAALLLPQGGLGAPPPELGLPSDVRLEALLALGLAGTSGEAAGRPEPQPVESYLAAPPPPEWSPGPAEERRVLLSFMEIASASAGAEDLDGVLETIARALGRLFPVDGAALGLLEDGAVTVREVLRRGGAVRRDPSRLPADESHLLGWVIARARPLFRTDTTAELRFAPSLPGDGMLSDMTIPLRARGRLTGAFRVACQRRHAFDFEDFEILGRSADLTSVAVETQRLLIATRRLSETDGLTGIVNHRQFMVLLEQEVERSRRSESPVALIMIDVDDFKRVNDLHGHPVGDEVLRHVAQVIGRTLRRSDAVARYGGEEFAVILPDSDTGAAAGVAEALRREVERRPLPRGEGAIPLPVRISLGVASLPSDARGTADLIAAADRCLYQAKRTGKNRVVRPPSPGAGFPI